MKITRKERHRIYLHLRAGNPLSDFLGIPVDRLERIWKEFTPGAAKPVEKSVPMGIMGNKWYCEAGCGQILNTKTDGQVFKARKKGTRYACAQCMEKIRKTADPA